MSFNPVTFGDDVPDPEDHLYAEMVRRNAAANLPITDADRWAHVRDCLSNHVHLDASYNGDTFTARIDNAIRQLRVRGT